MYALTGQEEKALRGHFALMWYTRYWWCLRREAKQLARSFRTAQNENYPFQGWLVLVVRNARIELAISAWEADVMPLN